MTVNFSKRDFTMEKKKILIVDDDQGTTLSFKLGLENNGYSVDTFNDPITALKSYKTNFYDIVILDIKMPKMDGFQLYTKLRELDPQVKICFLTASELFYEEFRKMRLKLGEEIGEEYFIQKPIKTNDLLKKLNTIMSSL